MDECLIKLQELRLMNKLMDSLKGKSKEDYEFQWGKVETFRGKMENEFNICKLTESGK